MEYELDQSRLALLRIHIALRSVTRSDRTLPKTIGPIFAGDAAAILATIYKGKNAGKYESAIIRAAWLAASSQVPGKAAESAIREAITIYVGRRDYASAGKLIQHLKEPVLSNQIENGQLLIDLLQGGHALQVRDAITNLVGKWGARHIAIIGPIDYVIAETYRSDDNEKYRHWLNMAEGNDFKEASIELNRLFFDFRNNHQVIGALRALGYDSGFELAGDDVNRQALLKNIATFGAAALGSSLGSAYYTLQNNDLITKLRLLSQTLRRVSPAEFPGVGRITKLDGQGEIQATGFLAYDGCTVVTALHALGGKLDDPTSFYLNLPLTDGTVQRSQIRVVAMGKSTGIPTSSVNDWLVGNLEPCAPEKMVPAELVESDRSFDSTDNTFAFELDKRPVIYSAVGFAWRYSGHVADRVALHSESAAWVYPQFRQHLLFAWYVWGPSLRRQSGQGRNR